MEPVLGPVPPAVQRAGLALLWLQPPHHREQTADIRMGWCEPLRGGGRRGQHRNAAKPASRAGGGGCARSGLPCRASSTQPDSSHATPALALSTHPALGRTRLEHISLFLPMPLRHPGPSAGQGEGVGAAAGRGSGATSVSSYSRCSHGQSWAGHCATPKHWSRLLDAAAPGWFNRPT